MKKTGIVVLMAMMSFLFAFTASANSPRKIKLYMAASLFNIRETRFNIDLVNLLETRQYQTILPQRDGFEYTLLSKTAKKYLPGDDVSHNVRDLIYLLDMGIFIPQSDIVIANLDEPLDDGVIVEITYAHLMGKPVIGYRTDVRTPYGVAEGLGGLHSFIVFQCDYLIQHHMSGANNIETTLSIAKLADKIDDTIRTIPLPRHSTVPDYALHNPVIGKLLLSAHEIIGNPDAIHTESGMKDALKRLATSKERIHIALAR